MASAIPSGVNTTCTHCRQPLFIAPEFHGRTVICPHCGGHLLVPTIAVHPLPPPVISINSVPRTTISRKKRFHRLPLAAIAGLVSVTCCLIVGGVVVALLSERLAIDKAVNPDQVKTIADKSKNAVTGSQGGAVLQKRGSAAAPSDTAPTKVLDLASSMRLAGYYPNYAGPLSEFSENRVALYFRYARIRGDTLPANYESMEAMRLPPIDLDQRVAKRYYYIDGLRRQTLVSSKPLAVVAAVPLRLDNSAGDGEARQQEGVDRLVNMPCKPEPVLTNDFILPIGTDHPVRYADAKENDAVKDLYRNYVAESSISFVGCVIDPSKLADDIDDNIRDYFCVVVFTDVAFHQLSSPSLINVGLLRESHWNIEELERRRIKEWKSQIPPPLVPVKSDAVKTVVKARLVAFAVYTRCGLVVAKWVADRDRELNWAPDTVRTGKESTVRLDPFTVDKSDRFEVACEADIKLRRELRGETPRSLEALHARKDGPPDISPEDWTAFKKELYQRGMLGHKVVDGVYDYRSDPNERAGLFRVMRGVRTK